VNVLEVILNTIMNLKETVLKLYKDDIKKYAFWKVAESFLSKEVDSTEIKNCDEIFCLYLKTVSEVTNPECFMSVVKFIILYRECMNKYGWRKFGKRLGTTAEEMKDIEYTSTNNTEFIPELSNELVLVYLPDYNYVVPVIDCINLTVNFCEWLLKNGFTCVTITSVKKE